MIAMKIPWQEHVLSTSASTTCGLVVFFLDTPEWPLFKEQIETAVHHGLHFPMRTIKNEILAKFTLHWVQSDTKVSLQATFISKRDDGEIPHGLRTDSFLFVDQEALRSRDSRRPFVWLWEPRSTTDQEDPGPLRIDIKHIAPTLFARLTQRDLSPEEARRKPYRRTSELPMLHHVTQYSKDPTSGERDGIWPPPARAM